MGAPFSGAQDPDGVLKSIESAVINRSFDDYRSVLADSFVYVADVGVEAMYPNTDWTQWGIAEEEGFLKRLLSPVLKVTINLTDKITERGMPYDHKALYVITYQINIEGRIYISEGTFQFVEKDNRWYLWKWEETMPVSRSNGGGFYSNSGEIRASLNP